MKYIVLSFIEDDTEFKFPVNDVAEIEVNHDEDYDLTVTLDDGTSYDCDYIDFVKED